MTRLVLVLGYSPRRPAGLHPTCAARVAHAVGIAADGDVVVLSGTDSELELMGGAWGDPPKTLRGDPAMRTSDSAVAAGRLVEELGADEVVLVTSWWHRPRAERMLRRVLRARGISVVGSGAPGSPSARDVLREAACFPLIPLHLAQARRRVRRPDG